MKYIIYPTQLQNGDMVNDHESGWLTVKTVQKLSRTFVEVNFTNGKQKTYFSGDKVDAIRG